MTTTQEHRFYATITYDVRDATALAIEGDSLGELTKLASMAWTVDHIMRDVAQAARDNGQSWAEIGKALGITRQAAQQKYGTKR